MAHGLGRRFMQRLDRRAREFELTAGFQRDVAAERPFRPLQRNNVVPLHDGNPAVALDQQFHQGADAPRTLVSNGLQRNGAETELLVFGADTPVSLRLCSSSDPGDEIGAAFDQRALSAVFARRHRSEGPWARLVLRLCKNASRGPTGSVRADSPMRGHKVMAASRATSKLSCTIRRSRRRSLTPVPQSCINQCEGGNRGRVGPHDSGTER